MARPSTCYPILVGREPEQACLLEAAIRPPAIVFVEGEAGVGKSRLVAALLRSHELADRQRLVGRCLRLDEPLPLWPFVDALQTVENLPDVIAGRGHPLVDRQRHFRATVELLDHIGPTVLVIEDLQWSDSVTLDLLRFLIQELPAGLTLILTYRPEQFDGRYDLLSAASRQSRVGSATTLALTPLSRREVSVLARQLVEDGYVSDEFGDYVFRRTSGNPFAVEQLVHMVSDRPDIVGGGRGIDSITEAAVVPPAIRHQTLEHLVDLTSDGRLMADAASVMEVAASEELLAKAAGLGRARAALGLTEVVRRGFIVQSDPGSYGFRHELARQSMYESIPSPLRRLLHVQAGHLFDAATAEPLLPLTEDFHKAQRRRLWLRHAESAADRALSRGDHQEAARLLCQVLKAPDISSAATARLAVKLGKVSHRNLVLLNAATGALQNVLSDDKLTPGVRGEIRLLLGRIMETRGQTALGREQKQRAIGELRRRPRLAIRAMVQLAQPYTLDGDLSGHLELLQAAMAGVASLDDPQLELEVRVARALLLIYVGDPRGWTAAAEVPWDTAPAASQDLLFGASVGLSGVAFHAGYYADGYAWLDRAARKAGEVGSQQFTGAIETHRLLLDWATGSWDGLEERARRHATRTADVPRETIAGQRIAGHLALARGDHEQAERCFDRFFDVALDAGVVPALASGCAGVARLHMARRDPEAAVAEASRGLRMVESKGIWIWSGEVVPATVEAMIACDRAAEAAALVERLGRGLHDRNGPFADAGLDLCRGMLAERHGRFGAAARSFRRAYRSYAALPRPYEAALASARLGRALLAAGDGSGSRWLIESLTAFNRLGATADAGRVRRLMKAHSIVPPRLHGGGRRPYGNDLSPREREVATAASQGRTNAQIASLLGLSPKTIEHHVAAAMRKLGVSSRTELGSALATGASAQAQAD